MISVLLPVHEPDLSHLETAIKSILSSSFQDLELLVIEDERTHGVTGLLERIADSRVHHVVNDRGKGLGAALNAGIAAAKGWLVARMDADDVSERDRLEKQAAMFDADSDLAVAGSQLTIVNARGDVIGTRRYPTTHDGIAETLTRYNCLAHSSVMFRKDEVLRFGGYTPGMWAEDYDLWCRMLVGGARFANHPQALVRYRFHESALKQRTVRPALRATIDLKKRHFRGRLGLRAQARLIMEQFLMLLPSRVVVTLFARIVYRDPS